MTILERGNCQCGNKCYTVIRDTVREEREEGLGELRFTVHWFHDPSKCPYKCEDCENEGAIRAEVEMI